MRRHLKHLGIVTEFRGSYCDCSTKFTNQDGIVLGHEHTFHSRLPYRQRYAESSMRLRRVTFHMTIGIW